MSRLGQFEDFAFDVGADFGDFAFDVGDFGDFAFDDFGGDFAFSDYALDDFGGYALEDYSGGFDDFGYGFDDFAIEDFNIGFNGSFSDYVPADIAAFQEPYQYFDSFGDSSLLEELEIAEPGFATDWGSVPVDEGFSFGDVFSSIPSLPIGQIAQVFAGGSGGAAPSPRPSYGTPVTQAGQSGPSLFDQLLGGALSVVRAIGGGGTPPTVMPRSSGLTPGPNILPAGPSGIPQPNIVRKPEEGALAKIQAFMQENPLATLAIVGGVGAVVISAAQPRAKSSPKRK